MSWVDVGSLAGLPERGARVVRVGALDIAVFRTGAGHVFALRDSCPHRGGPLSQGIVHGERVTCPLHDWVIDLRSGHAVGADSGCTPAFATRVADGRVEIELPDEHAAIEVPTESRDDSAESRPGCDVAFDVRVDAVFERA